ncbi:MAG: DNA translocase FtsK [Phycisphaerae bacterium]|nr:DNA translocase FtsK [Phycisphaerae bacterium]
MFGLLLVVFITTALVTFSPLDWPNPHVGPHSAEVHNLCGRFGAWVAYHLFRLLGLGLLPILLFVGAGLMMRIAGRPLTHLLQRCLAVMVITVATATAIHLVHHQSWANMPNGYSGILGLAMGQLMRENFSSFGAFLILGYGVFAAFLFLFDGFWSRVQKTTDGTIQAGAQLWNLLRQLPQVLVGAIWAVGRWPVLIVSAAGKTSWEVLRGSRRDAALTTKVSEPRTPATNDRHQVTSPVDLVDSSTTEVPKNPRNKVVEKSESDDAITTASVRTNPVIKAIFRSNQPQPESTAGCYPAVLDDWVLPPTSLLEEIQYTYTEQQESHARDKARILEDTLREFRVEANVVEIDTGPVITMFELRLGPGVKVSEINALDKDIARALKAPGVRVVSPIPGKNTVGIEVPRLDRERVRLKELMTVAGQKATTMDLPLFLGKDASGNPMIYDLARMPHMLIAGTTGSGKSVCINSIIMSLLMTQRPDRVKLILIDPKMVELSVFKDVPHLMCPIVTDMKRAEKILEWAVTKMDERYALLAEAGVRNIASFNQLSRDEILHRFRPASEEEAKQIPTHLAHVIIVIDELADLMMTSAKEVEHYLARIAQKSRAVGIHVVVATQRPEAKVVTGLIKSNLPCRCAFRVAARIDSRIVLDQSGAEVLLGSGDMLFLPPGSANLIRAQGTYIEDQEVHQVVSDLQSKGQSDFHPELMRLRSAETAEDGERDEMFNQAVRIVLDTQRGSVSLLQRRLEVGYSRASRLIDQMAAAGIVGDYKGSQAREVLITLEEWDNMANESPSPRSTSAVNDHWEDDPFNDDTEDDSSTT